MYLAHYPIFAFCWLLLQVGQRGQPALCSLCPWWKNWHTPLFTNYYIFYGCSAETDGTIGIVSKLPIPRQLVSVSVSIQEFLESRYQYRYRSRALSIFWKVLAEFLLSKVSVSISVPVQFHGISISIGLDVDWVWVSVSVSISIQGPIKYQYQYRLEISGPVCLWMKVMKMPKLPSTKLQKGVKPMFVMQFWTAMSTRRILMQKMAQLLSIWLLKRVTMKSVKSSWTQTVSRIRILL